VFFFFSKFKNILLFKPYHLPEVPIHEEVM